MILLSYVFNNPLCSSWCHIDFIPVQPPLYSPVYRFPALGCDFWYLKYTPDLSSTHSSLYIHNLCFRIVFLHFCLSFSPIWLHSSDQSSRSKESLHSDEGKEVRTREDHDISSRPEGFVSRLPSSLQAPKFIHGTHSQTVIPPKVSPSNVDIGITLMSWIV